jgi:7-cyano-7-deazaguanine tRNA-ribosyltransferase
MEEPISFLTFKKLSMIFNYQFGSIRGEEFFNLPLRINKSKKTGKIKHIYHDNNLLATLKPTNGNIVLSIPGGKRFLQIEPKPNNRVVITDEVEEQIIKGKDVYAKHILTSDERIRPKDEVLLVNGKDELLGIGRAILNGKEMQVFKYGLAVKTRKGVNKELK